jgi:hypothetical protein
LQRKPLLQGDFFERAGPFSLVSGNVLVICHLIPSIPGYQLPTLLVESTYLLGDPCELPRCALVVYSGVGLHAAAELSGIEHGLLDHHEDVALKDMRGDLRVAAAFDLYPVVVVLSRPAIAAVRGVMVHGHSARGAHDLLPPSKRRTTASAHAALNQSAEKVVRNGLAISGVMLPQPLLHLVELAQDGSCELGKKALDEVEP